MAAKLYSRLPWDGIWFKYHRTRLQTKRIRPTTPFGVAIRRTGSVELRKVRYSNTVRCGDLTMRLKFNFAKLRALRSLREALRTVSIAAVYAHNWFVEDYVQGASSTAPCSFQGIVRWSNCWCCLSAQMKSHTVLPTEPMTKDTLKQPATTGLNSRAPTGLIRTQRRQRSRSKMVTNFISGPVRPPTECLSLSEDA